MRPDFEKYQGDFSVLPHFTDENIYEIRHAKIGFARRGYISNFAEKWRKNDLIETGQVQLAYRELVSRSHVILVLL